MKYAITGASGLVGRNLTPKLLRSGCSVVVLGRNREKLESIYPALNCFDYSNLPAALEHVDGIIHLAIANNDSDSGLDDMRLANVSLLQEILVEGGKQNVRFILYTSTTHVNSGRMDSYTLTKREAEDVLAKENGMRTEIIRLPAVYSHEARGKQRFINCFPNFLQSVLVKTLRKIFPIEEIDEVCDSIIERIIKIDS